MIKYSILFILLLLNSTKEDNLKKQFITKQGQVTFFSYTTVENIQASNNTVYSIVDVETNEIAVSILIKAFEFKKSLMQSHFNESYIESDLYPKATFTGKIIDYDKNFDGIQTRIIKGDFTMRGISKPVEIKAQISKIDDNITISGETQLKVEDYKINIPPILRPNIADNIKVSFNLIHSLNEK